MADLYVYSVSLWGLSRILALHDPQTQRPSRVEVDETWLPVGGAQRPVAVVLGPKGERLVPASTGATGSSSWNAAACGA